MKLKHLLLKLMKFSCYGLALQVVFINLLMAYNGNAQGKLSSVKEVYITVNLNQASLTDLFSEIEANTDFVFNYDDRIVLNNRTKLNVKGRNTVADILLYVSEAANIKFKQVNNNINVENIRNRNEKSSSLEIILQSRNVHGRIISMDAVEALPGVNVIEKGTSNGTITDLDGNYSINVSDGAILVFSSVGYITEEILVGEKSVINLEMALDIRALEEIVVIGYGSQKKSVVTGSIASVKAADLENMPISRVEQSLQGRTAGLTIAASSGQPGSGSTVRVRGITSYKGEANDPLWIVDGVVVDNGGIGYLNQTDIESIEVLKDASAQAIYGARAAAGVILISTKKGTAGKISVNYNGFYGISAPARKLDMLNATEYAVLRNESLIAGGENARFADPYSLGEGSDWQSVIFNNSAKRQNHELSVSGGNDKSTFYTSFGYWDQEGIVATDVSHYTRFNFRINSTHKLKNWLVIGENIGYSREKNLGIDANSAFGGPLSSAINLDPLTPVVETDLEKLKDIPYVRTDLMRNAKGYPYGISDWVAQEMTNPMAWIQTRMGNYDWSDNVVGNVYAEIEPVKGLKVRSTLGTKFAYWGRETFTPVSYLNSNSIVLENSRHRAFNNRFNWNIENTVSYTKTLDRHNFTILLGQGAYLDGHTREANVTYFNLPVDNFDDASMNYSIPADDISAGAGEGADHTITSLFTRLNYDFGEKYLFTGVLRRDGSSRFGKNYKYGFFPSASMGWVISQEDFWQNNNKVNFLKLRGGYGVVGNDGIGDFTYLATIGSGRNYAFGTDGSYVSGFSPNAPANPDLRWEQTAQVNIGLETTLFNDLSVTLDWYRKLTSDLLLNPRIPAYVGAIGNPSANVGSMENTGLEVELSYTKTIRDLTLTFNGNLATVKNTVTDLGEDEFIPGGSTFHTMNGNITRTAVGQSFNSWFGFEKIGIFQTPEDVVDHTTTIEGEAVVVQPLAKPGDVIWNDRNKDGKIDENDRTFLGSPYPSVTFGLTVGAEYKGFDMMVFAQGMAGNLIFQGLRRLDVPNANYQRKALGRWTGPNTTNDLPRLVEGDPNKNFSNPSSLYLEKGDYLRFKTVQIGYTLPASLISQIGLEKARIFITGENVLTFTKYTGYDPEIGGNVLGIDNGIYPQARSFMVGVNIGF